MYAAQQKKGAVEVAGGVEAEEAEILTLYYGETVSEASARQLVERLESQYPDVEIEVIDGGQPHYHYIISAE